MQVGKNVSGGAAAGGADVPLDGGMQNASTLGGAKAPPRTAAVVAEPLEAAPEPVDPLRTSMNTPVVDAVPVHVAQGEIAGDVDAWAEQVAADNTPADVSPPGPQGAGEDQNDAVTAASRGQPLVSQLPAVNANAIQDLQDNVAPASPQSDAHAVQPAPPEGEPTTHRPTRRGPWGSLSALVARAANKLKRGDSNRMVRSIDSENNLNADQLRPAADGGAPGVGANSAALEQETVEVRERTVERRIPQVHATPAAAQHQDGHVADSQSQGLPLCAARIRTTSDGTPGANNTVSGIVISNGEDAEISNVSPDPANNNPNRENEQDNDLGADADSQQGVRISSAPSDAEQLPNVENGGIVGEAVQGVQDQDQADPSTAQASEDGTNHDGREDEQNGSNGAVAVDDQRQPEASPPAETQNPPRRRRRRRIHKMKACGGFLRCASGHSNRSESDEQRENPDANNAQRNQEISVPHSQAADQEREIDDTIQISSPLAQNQEEEAVAASVAEDDAVGQDSPASPDEAQPVEEAHISVSPLSAQESAEDTAQFEEIERTSDARLKEFDVHDELLAILHFNPRDGENPEKLPPHQGAEVQTVSIQESDSPTVQEGLDFANFYHMNNTVDALEVVDGQQQAEADAKIIGAAGFGSLDTIPEEMDEVESQEPAQGEVDKNPHTSESENIFAQWAEEKHACPFNDAGHPFGTAGNYFDAVSDFTEDGQPECARKSHPIWDQLATTCANGGTGGGYISERHSDDISCSTQ